jgi:hypothetical protein
MLTRTIRGSTYRVTEKLLSPGFVVFGIWPAQQALNKKDTIIPFHCDYIAQGMYICCKVKKISWP